MTVFRRQAVAACVFAAILASGAAAQNEDGYVELSVGITGQRPNTLTDLDDPVTVARMPTVSRLLQDIADAPRDAAFIRRALAGSDADLDRLVSLKLIRRDGGAYVINFPYLTVEDHDLLVSALDPYAEMLADEYAARWDEFSEIFSRYNVQSVPREYLAYAILGAFSLDWDGLTITARKNLRITAANMPQGLDFIPWAKEMAGPDSLKGFYWGSHNNVYNGVRFTTFGDHVPRMRRGLPDYIWRINGATRNMDEDEPTLSRTAYAALAPYRSDAMSDIGAILIAMRNGASERSDIVRQSGVEEARLDGLMALLAGLNYVAGADGGYTLFVPVLDEQDRAMLQDARDISNRIIMDHLDAHYDAAKADLAGLTGMKYGVPYKQLYTEIWHYLFGLVNLKLVERGYFIDPYGEDREYEGFAPFVFLPEIWDTEMVVSGQ